MREFSLYPHGAGRNFLGALQTVVRGSETVEQIKNKINSDNLFDGTYQPVHFNNSFNNRTNWNSQLIECQQVWIEFLSKRRTEKSARKIIIDNLNECYEGTFHIKTGLPTVHRYSIVGIVDSQNQHRWLDQLATIKKTSGNYTTGDLIESNLCYSNDYEHLQYCKADWSFDYTGFFFELNTVLIKDFLQRTEECFKVTSPVDTNTFINLIKDYTAKNQEILIYE